MGIDRLGSTPNAATTTQVSSSSSTANHAVKFSHFNKARTVNPDQTIPKGKARLLGKFLRNRKIQQVIIQKLLPGLANKIARAVSQQGVKDLLAGKVAVRSESPSGPQPNLYEKMQQNKAEPGVGGPSAQDYLAGKTAVRKKPAPVPDNKQNLYKKMQQNKAEPGGGGPSAQDYLAGKTAVRKDSVPANKSNLYQEMQRENSASKAENPSPEELLAGKTMVKPEASRNKAGSHTEQPNLEELRAGKPMIRKKAPGRNQPNLFDNMQGGAPVDKDGNKSEKPH